MKLSEEPRPGINVVKAYSQSELRVGEISIRSNCLLTADRMLLDWRPADVADLREADLEQIFELRPEIVIIGSGARQQFPQRSIMAAVMSRGIGLEVMDTGAACRTYNILVSEDRPVLAALFLDKT